MMLIVLTLAIAAGTTRLAGVADFFLAEPFAVRVSLALSCRWPGAGLPRVRDARGPGTIGRRRRTTFPTARRQEWPTCPTSP